MDATQVTVSGNYITSSVADTLLWDFTAAETSGMFDIKCDSTGTDLYLTRPSGQVYLTVNSSNSGAGNTDWKFEYGSSGSKLYLTGTSSKYYLTRSSSSGFNCNTTENSAENSAIYLFKYVQSNVPVGSVAITDITAPAAGETPDTSAETATAGVTLSSVTWSPSVTLFGYNTPYTASVTLTAQSGYAFTSETAVTVNGNAATSKVLNTNGTLTVTYAFPTTAKQQIGSVAVTGIEVPVAGQTPDAAAETTTAGVTLSGVTWSPNVTIFGYNTAYTASVTLTAGADYAFTSTTAVTVNGLPATTKTLNPDGTMTMTCAFAATAKQQIGSVAVTGIETPVAGELADQSATVATVGVASVSDVIWDPSVAAFGYNIAYKAGVTLTPAADYAFTSSTTATINGQTAGVTLNGDGTLTVTYTFPKTDNSVGVTLGISGPSQLMIGQSATYEVMATLDNAAGIQASLVFDSNFFELVSGNVTGTVDYTANQSATITLITVVLKCKASAATSGTISLDNLKAGRFTGNTSIPAVPVSCAFEDMSVSRVDAIASVAITEITAPEAGVMPDTAATVATAGVTASPISWAPTDTPFGFNTVYTASVTLTAGAGIAFAPGVTATVNGQAATSATLNGDGTLTVTYRFGATAMQIPNITGQPQNVTTIEAGTAQVGVTANVGKGTLSYQWYSNTADSNSGGTLISSAISSSYTVPTTSTGTTYYYCVITNTDSAGLGSASATAKTQTAKVVVKPATIQSAVYTSDGVNDVLSMVTLGTTVAQLKAKLLNDPADIKIFDGANEYTSGAVETGMTVKYYFDGNVIDQLTISVFGDPSGDGVIDIDDILTLRAYIIGTYTMTTCERAASDINQDGTIDVLDILYIRSHILLTYQITAQ